MSESSRYINLKLKKNIEIKIKGNYHGAIDVTAATNACRGESGY